MIRHFKALVSESLIYGLSGVISRFLTIFLVPIYTRIFTPEDYGVMSLVTTTMALVSIFVVLALDNSAHRWFWDTEELEDRKTTLASWAWCQIALSSVVALLIIFFSDNLAQHIVGRPDAALYFRLMALTLPLGALGAVTTNWLRLQRRPWATMIFTLVTSLLNVLITIYFVIFLGWGLKGVYVAQVIATVIALGIALWLMQDWVRPKYFNQARLRAMLHFGLPLIPAALAFWVVNLCDRYFIQFFSSTSEVGLYQVGSAIAAVVALGTGAFQLAWGPFALSIHKLPEAKDVYANVLLGYLWTTCVASTALTLFAAEGIRLIATEQYLGARTVVGPLAFSYVMIGLVYIAAIGPGIVKTTAPIGIAVAVAAALNVALNFLLVPTYGKEGAAVATLISQSAVPIYLFYRAQQMYPIPYRFGPAVSLVVLAWILIWIGSSWQFDNLWVGVIAKLALVSLFIPALFLLKIVTPTQALRLFRPATADVL